MHYSHEWRVPILLEGHILCALGLGFTSPRPTAGMGVHANVSQSCWMAPAHALAQTGLSHSFISPRAKAQRVGQDVHKWFIWIVGGPQGKHFRSQLHLPKTRSRCKNVSTCMLPVCAEWLHLMRIPPCFHLLKIHSSCGNACERYMWILLECCSSCPLGCSFTFPRSAAGAGAHSHACE